MLNAKDAPSAESEIVQTERADIFVRTIPINSPWTTADSIGRIAIQRISEALRL
jgi:hypothetical protein